MNDKSIISTVNLHQLSLDEVSVHTVNNHAWVTLGPISIFGRGDTSQDGLDQLRTIFDEVLDEIKAEMTKENA